MAETSQETAASQSAVPKDLASLDKSIFTKVIRVKSLRIPAKSCQQYMKLLGDHLLNMPRLKNTSDIPGDKEWKLILLKEGLEPDSFSDISLCSATSEPTTLEALISKDNLEVHDASVELGYAQTPASAVLRQLLPSTITEIPSSFETVGHVAHLNLRDEVLPYRTLIGQVLLDKNPRLKTVVNKLGTIENEWRVFDMEILSGEESTETEVKQHGLRFKLDFRKVYWNSRLEAEHNRLVSLFSPRQIILDVMAGIGPFVVPAARNGCFVLGNDLNPDSYKYLVENIMLNKVSTKAVPYNLDGREFIRLAAAGKLPIEKLPPPKPSKAKKSKSQQPSAKAPTGEGQEQQQQVVDDEFNFEFAPYFDHAVMNLPASAVEFLDAYKGAFDPVLWSGRALPWIHVYTFTSHADETPEEIRTRVESALGGVLDEAPTLHAVRDVAPKKVMYCVSFRLPASIAFAEKEDQGDDGVKRQRRE